MKKRTPKQLLQELKNTTAFLGSHNRNKLKTKSQNTLKHKKNQKKSKQVKRGKKRNLNKEKENLNIKTDTKKFIENFLRGKQKKVATKVNKTAGYLDKKSSKR